MGQQAEIPDFRGRWSQLMSSLQEISIRERKIPGAVNYSIRRFYRNEEDAGEDIGIVQYEYKGKSSVGNNLKLRFCVAGNMYCTSENCQKCTVGNVKNCADSVPCFDVVAVDYTAAQLSMFINSKPANSDTDVLLQFNKKESFQKSIPLCCKTRSVIEALVNHKYTGSLENIYVNAQLQMLLLYSMDWMTDKEQIISCRFLNSDTDREKIIQARDLLIQNIGRLLLLKN